MTTHSNTPKASDDAVLRELRRRLWSAFLDARKHAEACPNPDQLCSCHLELAIVQADYVRFVTQTSAPAPVSPRTDQ